MHWRGQQHRHQSGIGCVGKAGGGEQQDPFESQEPESSSRPGQGWGHGKREWGPHSELTYEWNRNCLRRTAKTRLGKQGTPDGPITSSINLQQSFMAVCFSAFDLGPEQKRACRWSQVAGCQPWDWEEKQGQRTRQVTVMPTSAFRVQNSLLTVLKCAIDSVLPLKNFPKDGLREGNHITYHPNPDTWK